MDIIAHRSVGQAHVFVVQGDLTGQPVEVVVNAANETLAHGGGVAAAIVGVGGRVIQEESDQWVRQHGPVTRGRAAVTTGGALQASHVVHVVGPRYQSGQDNEGMLHDATLAALDAAAFIDARSVAFPAISAGIFGYPRAEATRLIASTVVDWLTENEGVVEEVRLVGYDAGTAKDFALGLQATEEPA
jgi:putative ATPase